MTDRLYKVTSQVFGVPIEKLRDEDSPNSIDSWDSLGHINLVLALEAEFGVSISPDEAVEMLSIGAIRKVLVKHCVD